MNKIKRIKELEIAEKVNKNQKRFNGTAYINHPIGVCMILNEMGFVDDETIISAMLHDVLEDCEPNEIDILREHIIKGFGNSVLITVDALTKKCNNYDEYIDAVLLNKDAIPIKIADIIHNLTENPKVRQKENYRKALPKLIMEYSYNTKTEYYKKKAKYT